jgi:hypothetical protein
VIVVASIATHITATLSVVTATSIVKAKRLAKRRKRHASPGGARRNPGPRRAASAETPATQTASSADSASTRNSAVGPQVGTAPSTARAASHTDAITGTSASRACAPVIVRGYVRPSGATEAARSGGASSAMKGTDPGIVIAVAG